MKSVKEHQPQAVGAKEPAPHPNRPAGLRRIVLQSVKRRIAARNEMGNAVHADKLQFSFQFLKDKGISSDLFRIWHTDPGPKGGVPLFIERDLHKAGGS